MTKSSYLDPSVHEVSLCVDLLKFLQHLDKHDLSKKQKQALISIVWRTCLSVHRFERSHCLQENKVYLSWLTHTSNSIWRTEPSVHQEGQIDLALASLEGRGLDK